MAEPIGRALARVTAATSGEVSQELSTADWSKVDLSVLTDLPERLDDQQLAAVQSIARLPLPALPPAGEPHFLQCMRTLTLLPSRQEDDLSAELRLALYRKHFGKMPAEAWSYLVEHATLECRFFPSPKECKAILDKWDRTDGPARAVSLAQTRARHELQARMEETMERFREGEVTQAEVDALPEQWRRIAATRGYLWEGTYKLRPVRKWGEEQEGQGPAVSLDQHTEGAGKAGRPHEGTGL